jgi:hypothetical protein
MIIYQPKRLQLSLMAMLGIVAILAIVIRLVNS